jgi:Rrf2 family transcriptional regulator, nitric oxide-sensitive transcriptional repressor
MQLTQFTDYALRTLIYVALKKDRPSTVTEIADNYGISKNHLVKVVHKLGQLGILETIRGNQGGIKLNGKPADVNIGALVQQIEPHFFVVECFDSVNQNCVISPACKLKHVLGEATNNFIETLNEYTLEDITQNSAELSGLLQQ